MTVAEGGTALVIGYGLSGRAAASWLLGRGWDVTVLEDDPKFAKAGGTDAGLKYVVALSAADAAGLASQSDLVVPSPGVPVAHPALAAAEAAGVEVVSELELGWEELASHGGAASPRAWRLVAVTGTNGKTTVTQLVTAMLKSSGVDAVAAGNVGYPLLQATSDLAASAATVFVTEVSSFQLQYSQEFRPDVSCWLNFAPDHLDWHPSVAHYAAAKARVWAKQGPGSTAVVNLDDPVVMAKAAGIPAGVNVVTFGAGAAAWRLTAEGLEGPDGFELNSVELPRGLPHDIANTAAAFAVALAAGGTLPGCVEGARHTPAPPHRLQLVRQSGGVAWYDDSKATTPASVLAAVKGFSSVVLIAGGRNKGLDLSVLAATAPPVRSVVAIGESSAAVQAAFVGRAPVRSASSMEEAVSIAASLAQVGDAVVLSPGCASFDWYTSYAERGDHFASLVKARLGEVPRK